MVTVALFFSAYIHVLSEPVKKECDQTGVSGCAEVKNAIGAILFCLNSMCECKCEDNAISQSPAAYLLTVHSIPKYCGTVVENHALVYTLLR